MNNIHFFEENIKSRLSNKKNLKIFLNDIISSEKMTLASLSFIFCRDKYLIKINNSFLKHNYFTDTISFLLSAKNEPISGEVYISCERVSENSKNCNVSYQQELIRVIIHSTLHLCGYTDQTEPKKSKMIALQEAYLNTWIVSRETANK